MTSGRRRHDRVHLLASCRDPLADLQYLLLGAYEAVPLLPGSFRRLKVRIIGLPQVVRHGIGYATSVRNIPHQGRFRRLVM